MPINASIPLQVPNTMGIVGNAMQIRGLRQRNALLDAQTQALQQKQAQNQLVQQLSARAAQGDPQALNALAGLDPNRAQTIGGIQRDARADKATFMGRIAASVLNSPNPEAAYPVARQMVLERYPDADLPPVFNDETAQDMRLAVNMAQKVSDLVNTPQSKNAVNVITPDGTPHLSYDGGRTIMVNGQTVAPPQGRYIGSVQGGAQDVGMKLGSAVKNKAQQRLIDNRIQLDRLDRLAKDYKSSYLTYGGRAEAAIGNTLSKAGIPLSKDMRKAVAGRRRFTQGINQMFNKYRHDITGAQATMQEINYLREAMLNDKLSPAEFDASLKQYRESLQRISAIERQALQEGLTPGTKPFGERVDELFTQGRAAGLQTQPVPQQGGMSQSQNTAPSGGFAPASQDSDPLGIR